MASSLVAKLTAEGEGENAAFLNDTVAALWPNINRSISKIIKDSVEPILKSTLPSPLSNLKFVKVDLGSVPLTLSNFRSTKLESGAIELDLNLDWKGNCDIELDGDYVPAVGVEHVKLNGALTILLAPLTDVIPLIGAMQVSFINPPNLELDFTGAANVADFSLVDDTIRGIILGIINSMFTLPNRYLVKLDVNTDYFKAFLYPLGVIRITAEKAWGFSEEAKGSTKKFFDKITRAAPDCYVKVDVGAEERWQTSTKNNTHNPVWGETRDFVVSDFDQCIKADVFDHDVNAADHIGLGVTTVREILLAGGKQELPLVLDGKETKGKVSISASFMYFAAKENSFAASEHTGEGLLCGVATILVAGAYGVPGQRKELKPSVVVTWGEKHRFQTTIQSDYPGYDINNPSFDQNFRVPVTSDLVGSNPPGFRFALMDGEKEIGKADVPFGDVLKAPNFTLEQYFEVGGGASVRASICLRGVVPGKLPDAKRTATLPERKK